MKNLTPRIDSIARHGVRFAQAYTSGSVCSPSRAGLMTGRYQQRFGHDMNIPPGHKGGLPLSETFGSDRLRTLGYTTGLIGKWHLGYPADYQPNKRGFDRFYGLLQGSRGYYPAQQPSAHTVIQENGLATEETGYVTDRFGDAACRFIREHKDKPFFLFVSFTAPHSPLQPRLEPDPRLDHITSEKRRKYAGLVVALDDNVGKILDAIAQAGIERNTLVVFTNDNGGQTMTGADNFPLRDGKGSIYEGGFGVPIAMRWPGRIERGLVIDEPVILLDLLPTFIAAAGGSVDPAWQLDGVNLLPRLVGEKVRLETRTLYWRNWARGTRATAVREGNWRLVFEPDRPIESAELYNLANDIGETKNLAAQHPDVVRRLSAKGIAWQAEFPGPRWGKGSQREEDN